MCNRSNNSIAPLRSEKQAQAAPDLTAIPIPAKPKQIKTVAPKAAPAPPKYVQPKQQQHRATPIGKAGAGRTRPDRDSHPGQAETNQDSGSQGCTCSAEICATEATTASRHLW